MQAKQITSALTIAAIVAAIVCLVATQQVSCQQNGSSGFGVGRPSSGSLFEPTMNFIRQNMRLVNSYVALMRSIFVGAYERPLITSTDAPASANKGPAVKVPPMDLPRAARRN